MNVFSFIQHVKLGDAVVQICRRELRLNRKVERSHLIDTHMSSIKYWITKGDIDLRKKLAQWEDYYNFLRP